LRHTWASTSPGKETRVSQRQAVLRMLTADFCGDGTSFTENGTRIQFDAYRRGPFLGYAEATSKGSPPTTRRPLQELTPPGDAGPGMPLAPGWAPTLLEAIWNDRGAICLEPTTRIPIPTPVVCGSPPSKQWTIPRCTSNDMLAASAPSSTGCPDLSGNYLISATAHPL
jgi:hypothetical protein